jgi:Type III secretion protein (HpaP)
VSQEPRSIVRPAAQPPKPAHRPATTPLGEGAGTGRLGRPSRVLFDEGLGCATRSSDGSEAATAVVAITAAGGSSEPAANNGETGSGINVDGLCDRIAGCLALHAETAGAWAVSVRLRGDLLPAARMHLASDSGGRLTLRLGSASREVVDAVRSHAGTLSQTLKPWSRGDPEVRIELGDLQDTRYLRSG